MPTITLDAIVNAITTHMPDATLAEQGEAIAATVKRIDTDAASIADPAAGTGAAMKANWQGRMMKAGAGTATPGQQRWHVEHGMKPAAAKKLSMVAASDKRAKLEGKV